MDDLTTASFPYHQMTDGVLQLDASHRIQNADTALCTWLDITKAELIGRLWPSLFHPFDRPLIDTLLESFNSSGEAHALLQGILKNNNADQLYLQLHRPPNTPDNHYYCLIMNLGKRINYTSAKRHYERLFELSNDLLCIANTMGYLLQVNNSFTRVLGYTKEELINTSFLDFVHPEDVDATVNEIRHLRSGMDTLYFENRYRRKDGSWCWLAWSTPAPSDDGLLFAVAKDITERKELENKLARLAKHDVLTNLPNQTYLEDELKRAMARAVRNGHLLAGFQVSLHDASLSLKRWGRNASDDLILQFGLRLRHMVRINDFVARISDDAFFLVAELEHIRQVQTLENKLRLATTMEFHWQGQSCSIEATLGTALYQKGSDCTPYDFIHSADATRHVVQAADEIAK